MVRMSAGVLVILPGQRRDLAELRSGLAELGPVALARDIVVLEPRAPLRVHSKAWGPSCLVREVWSLKASVANDLVLVRLGQAEALAALLGAATRRPQAEELGGARLDMPVETAVSRYAAGRRARARRDPS